MYITLEVWHVPLGFRVYRPLTVLIVTVGEVTKMKQILHLGLCMFGRRFGVVARNDLYGPGSF